MPEEINKMDDLFANRSNIAEYSVTEFSTALRNIVESHFDHICIRGEISGLKIAASGHIYFSLKDENAVLSAICWRAVAAKLKLQPEDGLEVRITGRITTYAGRSNYQVIVEKMELTGEGALLKLFENRKKKLAQEGLFDADHKKPLPFIPRIIGVVTSPTGSVIQDILHRISERFPSHVVLWPTLVQGEGAAEQICAAIDNFNLLKQNKPDIIILARGGGSLEDLWCFNEENVARSIFKSDIPIISAIGHETDTSLSDYVADKRAPTPTAAAEMAVPVQKELGYMLQDMQNRIRVLGQRFLANKNDRLSHLSARLPLILRRFHGYAQRLDMWNERLNIRRLLDLKEKDLKLLSVLIHAPDKHLEYMKDRIEQLSLQIKSPHINIGLREQKLHHLFINLDRRIHHLFREHQQYLTNYEIQLKTLSHENILSRGYTMVTDNKNRVISQKSDLGDAFIIHFKDGQQKAIPFQPRHKSKNPKNKKEDIKQGNLFG